MKIEKATIKFFQKDGFTSSSMDGIKHIKILPYLSIVQSVEGSYDITINKKSNQTTDGGFFIAPSEVQQTIIHHNNISTNKMICRWIFLDVEINDAYKLDSIFDFPVIVSNQAQKELCILFDELFSTDDALKNYVCLYKIICLLVDNAAPSFKANSSSMQNVIEYMKQNYKQKITISALSQIANMSEPNFYAVFKRTFGSSPISYLNSYRLSVAAQQLCIGCTVADAATFVGISDSFYFSKLFKKAYGMSPKKYRLLYGK